MKTSAVVGVLVVLAVLAIAGFLLFSPATSREALAPTPEDKTAVELGAPPATVPPSPTPTTAASPIAAARVTVEITDTGFKPAQLTVSAGTTVTFVNNGQGLHWIASNPHPTHTGLPGFDVKKGLATGETYAFTFTQVGSWGYHDHLNPGLRGTIIVQ